MTDTYLVTGGTGLIGGYTVKALVERGDDVVVLDVNPPSGRMKWVLQPIWDKVTFVQGSISDDFPALLKACKDHDVKRVFHAAALFNPSYEIQHPYYSFHVTVEGMLNVCEAARILGFDRVVFAGTIGEVEPVGTEEYTTEPLDEYVPMYNPAMGASPYSSSKKCATIIGLCYWQTQGVSWINTRFSRCWGFGSKRSTIQTEGLIIENAVDGIPTVLEEGDVKRGQTYAKALAKGVVQALDIDDKTLKHRVFYVGGDYMASDREVAAIIKELIPEAEITIKKGGVSRRSINTKLAQTELGWKPMTSSGLKAAVKDYLDTYQRFKTETAQ
jgi:nucleoside-diphosphate-sugar epimerase